jgi:translation initiation factor 1 (eIF-1/SUI1)
VKKIKKNIEVVRERERRRPVGTTVNGGGKIKKKEKKITKTLPQILFNFV